MRTKILLPSFAFAVCLIVVAQRASADPCGMVPPIYPGQEIPLSRVGLQQTYVSYKDGVETFVIRPGFTGKVDQFGMLIPFPTPPAIRKVPDHIFGHIAAAVDPPEVVVDLRYLFQRDFAKSDGGEVDSKDPSDSSLKYKDEVKVLKQEAVGMYEVAVLAAGSAAALKRWMDDHGYKYPKGMDKPCEDYVAAGWCFVAVKTKVGQKDGVDPKPGQRTVNAKLPKGSTFDGHVQGMGFRFKSDELVVPMRLSAFNKGELRNVVYLLTDGPRKIRSIPEEYVVRQISGQQLYNNLTQPLPLRILGGTEADIPESRRKLLPQQRNPVPKNGAAGELFASDLLAIQSRRLSLPHEEREKELLRIGERFGLRGADIDKLNNQSLGEERRKTVEESLSGLKDMTLTVVDGDFPREVLGKQNLTFAEYTMPSRRNRPTSYDAKLNGPSPQKEGILKVGTLTPHRRDVLAGAETPSCRGSSTPWVFSFLIVALVGFLISVRLKAHTRWMACFLFLSSFLLFCGALGADELSYYEKTLAEKNIKTDSDGLNEYLSGLHPSEQQRQRAMQLIEALGATDSFAKREDAMAKLLVLSVLPNEELIAAAGGKDPEIRWRAKKILQLGKPESDRVLYAAFRTIEEKTLAGVTAELIRAIPLCDKPHLRYAARQSLKASARPNDAALLRRELKNENVDVRIAVVAALGIALDEKASGDLNNLLNDPQDRVKLAAARALANLGDRKSLEPLGKLLSSDDKLVRTSSALALHGLTGKRFGFSAHHKPDKRSKAIAKWTAWIAGEGKTAALSFPLRPFGTGVSYLGGNTLLAFGTHNKIVEYDPSGQEVWSFTTTANAWSAEKLANGNVLIGVNGQQGVIEVDRSGSIVWQFQANSPLNAKQLLNGNYLIADWGANRAVEVDPEKNVIWQYKTQSHCGDVHRLENGNTLLAEYQGNVKEVTTEGKVVWQYPAPNCYGIQPLPNGNVLVTNLSGRVIEVTRDKQIVWECSEPGAVDAFRLANGNTLITGNSRFIEVTPDKKIVWTKTGCSYGTARR